MAAVTTTITMNGEATISAPIIRTLPTVAPAPPSRMPSAPSVPMAVAMTQISRPMKNVAVSGRASLRTMRWPHSRSMRGT